MLEKRQHKFSLVLCLSYIFYTINLIFKKICIILASIFFISMNLLVIDLYFKTKNNESISILQFFLIGFCLFNTILYFTLNHFDKVEQINLKILEELRYRNDEEDKIRDIALQQILPTLKNKENDIVK